MYISSLAFISCGHSNSAAVNVISVQQSNISNCSFHNNVNDVDSSECDYGPGYYGTENYDYGYEYYDYGLAGNYDYCSGYFKSYNTGRSYDGGGALNIQNSSVRITGSIFQNNSADDGGVAYVAFSTLTVTDNTFQKNSADNSGGVLFVLNSTLIVTGNIFQINSAIGQKNSADGGGVAHIVFSTLTVTDNTFQNNSADYFGGILIVLNSTLTVTNNAFRSNSAGGAGGVLFILNSIFTVTDNTFQNNSAGGDGGVLLIGFSNLTVTGNIFQSNSAGDGGVAYVAFSTLTVTNNTFRSNSADDAGGVLFILDSIFTVTDNTFQNNSAGGDGGVLLIAFSNLTVTGNTFQNNSADGDGGVLHMVHIYSILSVTDNTFQNNSAYDGGVAYIDHSTLTITDNTFQNNSAGDKGGVLLIGFSNLTVTGNTFQNNSATIAGGIISMEACRINFINNNFTDSSAKFGGAIFMYYISIVRMHGNNIIENNRAQYGGGVAAFNSRLNLPENTIFENNRAIYGGGLFAHATTFNGNALFTKNFAFEGGGGIYASRSTFRLTEKKTIIKNNSAADGGGLLLSDNSILYLQPNIAVHLISNSATRTGGAIKVEETNPLAYCHPSTIENDIGNNCFFQIQTQIQGRARYNIRDFNDVKDFINSLNVTRIMMYFDDNSAVQAGTELYGGNVDYCELITIVLVQYGSYSGPALSGYVFDVITSSENKLTISSDPLDICSCVDNLTDCIGSQHPKPVYPGGTLEVAVIARGQRKGTTPAVIQVVDTSNDISVSNLEISQNILNSCSPLKYTIQSRAVNTTQEITLYAEGPCPPTETNTLTVTVDILPCPPGFQLSETQPICICAKRLQQFTSTCLIDNATVLRAQDDEFWVGYGGSGGLILHPHCPFDYCTSEEVYLAVDDSDKQCNYNRSGLLCGTCSDNFSLALGSSRCLQCSNYYLTLLAAFAFAGIALVLLLLVLRLTVAVGTINGLIFYANIVAVNSQIFFQYQSTNVPTVLMDKVFTLFVAWLNLDFGIETCFYNGMNAYVKTWLQFVFPFYVWALVGMIIVGSYYSGRVAKIFGSNPIAVLATLFLLSYAKLLRTVIAALSYTSLEYPNNSHISVWLHDGNVRYLSGKHIPLFTIALILLIFLFFPYMMLLVFSQWLQAKSKFKIISWINSPKVKPFLDAYHAPYTDKHRYWTGLMLMVRFVLFLISAVNALGDPSVNLLAIASTTAAILTLTTLSSRIYKTWNLGLLETSFILNLTILAVATLYIRLTGGNQNAATCTSVGIAFTIFVGIIIYHSVQQAKDTRWMKKIFSKLSPSPQTPGGHTPEKTSELDYENSSDRPVTAPTTTVIDLYELHPYMLREPCMETSQ